MPGIADITFLGVAPDRAKVLCIFVHGRNQSPEEMEMAVIRHLAATDVAYALPRAQEKCWYNALAVAPRTVQTEAELHASLTGLRDLVRRMRALAPGRPLVLGGFSQGACLSIEHAFGGLNSPDALIAFTGCRVGVVGDVRDERLADQLPVYLTAGSADPWIPLNAFAEATVELGRGGARLRTDVFPARPHEVCAAEIAMLDLTLAELAAGRRPTWGAAR